MGLVNKKRKHNGVHGYAYLISGLVSVSLLYTLFGGDSDADAKINQTASLDEQYSASAILSNDFNYGFGKTPKPDSYPPEVRISSPQWLSLENPVSTIAIVPMAEPEGEQTETILSTPVVASYAAQDTRPRQDNRPRIAIIIDDMGVRQNMTRSFAALPTVINFSFLPYAEGLSWQTQLMNEAGHELMLHMPMEPSVAGQNPGPKALLTSMSVDTIDEYLNWNLSRFDGFVGINNHMGSRFTENAALMTAVLEKLKTEGLFFIDSRTTSKSTGYDIAKEHGLQYEDRDVFLDNELSHDAIFAQFAELERIAQRNGSAIAIGHPHGETLAALEMWLPTLEERGFNVVKVSSLLKQHDPQAEVLTTEATEANEQAGYSGGGN